MGRPRTFDEEVVLDAAAAEFRVFGFADTSTEQLCDAAGMRRSSLYNAFDSKDELFVRALQRYTEQMRQRQEVILGDPGLDGAGRLRALIGEIIAEERSAREAGHAAGCMSVQSFMAPGLRERNERIALILDRDLRARLDLLKVVVRAGQADGSIPADIDPREGALLVTTVISGIRVTAQAGLAPAELHRIALAGLRALLS